MMEMNVLSCALPNVMKLMKCDVMEDLIITVVCTLNFAGQAKEVCNFMRNVTFKKTKLHLDLDREQH